MWNVELEKTVDRKENLKYLKFENLKYRKLKDGLNINVVIKGKDNWVDVIGDRC